MVTAFVFINTKRTKINEVAEALADHEGVSEVYSVSGRFDLIAMIRVKNNEDLADLVTHHLVAIDGIERTETQVAFRTFSQHDLERMFSIGFEEE